MLMPDVTSILYDPEVGGGQPFQVTRNTSVRKRGGYQKSPTVTDAVGNVQPQTMTNQTSTTEDLLNESIVIFSTFCFQTGSNTVDSIVEADVVLYNGIYWRVTNVEDWSKWGYTKAYATRIMDYVAPVQQTVTEG